MKTRKDTGTDFVLLFQSVKYGWVIHQNLFAQANQDSIFLHAGGLKKDWVTFNDRMISSIFSSIATV